MKRRDFISSAALAGMAMGISFPAASEDKPSLPTKIGIIGLDTSHSPAFAKYFNLTDKTGSFRVVAAYPHGSADIESSVSRIPKFTDEVKTYGVEIVDSIK